MQSKFIKKIIISSLVVLMIVFSFASSYAIDPGLLNGEIDSTGMDLDFMNRIGNIIRVSGSTIAIGGLMLIGIGYILGSVEDKANYKKSMIPYIIGCIIIFGASNLQPKLQDIITTLKTGTEDETQALIENIVELIRVIGIFVSVGTLMVLGIKYAVGSIEDRASYKKSMMPYLIGCFVLFGASNLVPPIKKTIEYATVDEGQFEDVMRMILGVIQIIGAFVSVGTVMVLGIKYMAGSIEERASYKKSMLPYIIGCVLIFSATNITPLIYDSVQQMVGAQQQELDASYEEGYNQGYSDGRKILNPSRYTSLYNKANERYKKFYDEDPESTDTSKARGYIEGLRDGAASIGINVGGTVK